MHDLTQWLLSRLPNEACSAFVPLWQSVPAVRMRCLAVCRQGNSNMEYAVFAGMIGMTLLIMFQLYGDSLTGTLTSVLHRLQASIDGVHTGGGK